MAGWFELSKSSDDQYRFVLKAGIASVQANSPLDERYEKKTAANGKLHFNLKAANHQIIGSSQLYANEQSRETGIASVKTNGASQTIKDKT